MRITWRSLMTAAAMAGAAVSTMATAQPYPTQPIKMIVPFTPGGGTDVTARMLAEYLGPKLGQAIVVENRPGASAGLGAIAVTQAAPNGYTLLVGSATLASNAVVAGPNSNFDPLNGFDFIGKVGQIDLIIVSASKLKIDNLPALVSLMRTQPGKVQFGSPGIGAPAHLGGELLKQVTKGDALHVPYKGESAALTDLIAGVTTFQLCAPLVCVPRIQDGTLKGLAVTAKHRPKMAPAIPTTAEAGAPGVEAGTWYYLAAPKGTPPAIINKLNAALNEVLADEKFRSRSLSMGVDVEPGTTPAAVKTALQAEMDKWRPVVKAAGITVAN